MRPVFAALAIAALAVAGCRSMPPDSDLTLRRVGGSARVVVMPIDIQVAQFSSLGLMIPVARWTRDARRNVRETVFRMMRERQIRVVNFEAPEDRQRQREMAQLARLHRAVARSMQRHRGGGRNVLPARDEKAGWTLGKGAADLAARSGADYALFLRIRDSYTSAGRVVQIAFLFARSGFLVPGGRLEGYASLVDLRSGDIVWFRPLASDTGDLRTAELADKTLRDLLEGFPR